MTPPRPAPALILLLALAGCGATIETFDGNGGTVHYSGDQFLPDAKDVADRHCRPYGLHAVMGEAQPGGTEISFVCAP